MTQTQDKILTQLFSNELQLELGYSSRGVETFGTGSGAYNLRTIVMWSQQKEKNANEEMPTISGGFRDLR